MRRWIHLFSLLLIPACNSGNPSVQSPTGAGPDGTTSNTTPPEARTPLIGPDHQLYARLEAPNAKNACASDGDCVKGGCSSEVCAAESVVSTCEMPAEGWPVRGASCGCVAGQCQWFSADGH